VNPSLSTSLLNSDDFIKKCDSLPYLLQQFNENAFQMMIQKRFSSEKEQNDAILKYLEEKSIKIDTDIRSFVAAFPSMLVESGEKGVPVTSRGNGVKEDKQSLLWKYYLSKLYEINHNMIQNNKENDLDVDPSLRNEKKYYKEKSVSYLKDIYSSSLSLYGQHHQFTQRTVLSLFSSYLCQYDSSHSPIVTTSSLSQSVISSAVSSPNSFEELESYYDEQIYPLLIQIIQETRGKSGTSSSSSYSLLFIRELLDVVTLYQRILYERQPSTTDATARNAGENGMNESALATSKTMNELQEISSFYHALIQWQWNCMVKIMEIRFSFIILFFSFILI
jgi:hypothetical protein